MKTVYFDSADSVTHSITISANPAEGGTVTASPEEANADNTVTLSTSANEGYVLSILAITYGSGSKIEPAYGEFAGDYTFTMPGADINAVGNFVTETYAISDGAKSTYNGSDMVFRSNADFSKFVHVDIDGAPVDLANYTAESGSTKVTLKSSYLDTLEFGEHDLDIVSTDGYAETNFTISEKAGESCATKTGDTLRYAPLGLAVLGLGIAGAVVVLRKRFN